MPGFGFGNGFGHSFKRPPQFSLSGALSQTLEPGQDWNGQSSSGFASAPVDPVRVTAKPVCRLITPPRQTARPSTIIGVFAAANDGGSLTAKLGMSHVDFHCEGNVIRVNEPTYRSFRRTDGSTYRLLGWWATLSKPASMSGVADVYIEAVAADASMQSRILGPYSYLMPDAVFDHDITVAASGGGDYTTVQDAFAFLRGQSADHPRITIIEAGDYELNSAGLYMPAGWCLIEATQPVTFRQPPPALEFDFTRFRPGMDRLHFKGSNITIDFVETLEFYTEQADGEHWLDGVHIVQSRGREDLWRGGPRNIIPALFRNGAWFTECSVEDVNDAFDKAMLVRGCQTDATWADLAQDARCFVCNSVSDHTSGFYYTNVDAMSIAYAGAGTPTISIRNSPRRLVLRVDGADMGEFELDPTEQAFRDDTNYRVASAVAWVNSQPDWSATLIDDSRQGAALSPPGTTNGGPAEDISVPATLPTHFDIHSDIYQLPILSELRENVIFAFNSLESIDAQNIFLQLAPGMIDSAFIGNAFYNNLGTPDEGLATNLAGLVGHGIFVHNTLATQRMQLPAEGASGDAYTLIANNVARRMTVSGNATLSSSMTVSENHVVETAGLPAEAINTTNGGDSTTLFGDAINGDFTPQGLLLTSGATPVILRDLTEGQFPSTAAKGAIAASATIAPSTPLPSWTVDPTIDGIPEVGSELTGTDGTIVDGTVTARQWLRDGVAIAGATASTYTPIPADEGTMVSFAVEATGDGGTSSAESTTLGPITAGSVAGQVTLVDSLSGAGSSGAVSASGLSAVGNDRYVFAMVGAGTSDSVNDIACSITGTGGTVAMTRVFFRGTNFEPPASAFEAFAGFVIDEASLPGDGPYNFAASATGANVPDKLGIIAGSVRNATNAPVIVTERATSVTATPASDNSFVFAGLGSSTGSGNAGLTGATQIENLDYGDGLQLAWTLQDAQSLTVTNSVTARSVSALVIFAPASAT